MIALEIMPLLPGKRAPQAIEVADRFHLVKNLAEAVEKALVPCRAERQKGPKAKEAAQAAVPEKPLLSLVTGDGQPYSAHQTERHDRSQQAMAWRKQGMIVKEIAKRVGLGRRTIQRWVKEETYVETNYHHPHRSRFDAYATYVTQRWDGGCQNIQQIWPRAYKRWDIPTPIVRDALTLSHFVAR